MSISEKPNPASDEPDYWPRDEDPLLLPLRQRRRHPHLPR